MPSSPEFFDLSRPLESRTAVWPGDVPFSFRLGWSMADGASVNVGSIQASVHSATHVDAPFHFDNSGPSIDRLDLIPYLGAARVVDVRGATCWRSRLEGIDLSATPRLLFRTGGWPNSENFPDPIPVMEPDLPGWLAEQGVCLIGVDLPSVDEIHSKTLDRHHALNRAGIRILEGLWLENVPEGAYELISLPLKISGADGSPVRAILRRLPGPG